MSDLTEAANRLLTEKHYNYWESNRNPGACDDAEVVATWAAKMLDETPIDEAWLQSVGFVAGNGNLWLQSNGSILSMSDWGKWHWFLSYQGLTGLPEIKTRGQLRMLATALGIELKESR